MDTEYSSEMLVSVYCTTWCHILHDNNVKADSCINQKTYDYLYFQKSTSLIEFCCHSTPVVSSMSDPPDREDRILSLLGCPECTRNNRPHTVRCVNGLVICNKCRQEICDCVTCSGEASNFTNRAREYEARKGKYPPVSSGPTDVQKPAVMIR